ncbi:CRISP-associated protein Cas1 [Streptoalloteichus tenebrarius]|uniref:CRISPR-associated endonuclease Cas1 n=1 Tax=Streptoalloteichus tenebrarius (strain ATCC 17920 / DSM 40477 / JCM 4838 / CBS 697.72 / NBRC 16177 / NCIMB 11028 / NRRL B-12390 / A12253. 1 / ISP 5477) TaxID=1933 RepID=A0ABT1I1M4_STRSD|nr:CRISPR-associated endonuclease Cas1 [Streptoalloteichus tenebrarius]MCP2261641.1 CRISP-associated protein Cas1 [Streptoalloteichus tenebrarius]BFE99174.1 CRISPR-associated endonuclease Cas1 [Streptoalloteichus tenebrarius]
MVADESPELIPARMVNEYVYCPRLFYLEWVDGRFADSDDVALGRHVHRRVDIESGSAPRPEEGVLREARSLLLSSPALGVIARLDVVEGEQDHVVAVDYKKGKPRSDGTPWPSDEVQVVLHVLLLREHGYTCDRGEVYYAATRQRVPIVVDEDKALWARECVARARAISERLTPPLPLVDSPKCVRCSLVGLCLPDETNTMLGFTERAPRRIVPKDPDTAPVYVTEPGSMVRTRSQRLEVTKDDEVLASFRMIDVSQLAVFGRVQISTQTLHELFDRAVPVLWFTYGGWLKGWAYGLPSKYVELRRQQTITHAQGGLGLARQMIAGKIHNCRTLIRRNARCDQQAVTQALAQMGRRAATADSLSTLLGIEGTAARLYFQAFPSLLAAPEFADAFAASGRNRRPPRDPVNAMLSFSYALLLKDLIATTLAVGLDPYLGVYHRIRYGRPALALDLAEEFRPLIADSTVLSLINNAEISASDFISRAGAFSLTPNGRRTLIRAYERRLAATVTHPLFGYTISYRRVLDVQARILAGALVGELSDYTPMTTR